MQTNRQRRLNRGTDSTPDQTDETPRPWAQLSISVPNERNDMSIVTFVECVLVELTHEDVGAEYVASRLWGNNRTQFIADETGETFEKRCYDKRVGWYETTISRQELREELVDRLTRPNPQSTIPPDGETVGVYDTFCVKPVRQLRRDYPPYI